MADPSAALSLISGSAIPHHKRDPVTVAVLGAGAFGTALAVHMAKLGHTLRIWAFEKDVVEDINTNHKNRFLSSITLPPNITASSDMAAVLAGAEFVWIVSPTAFVRSVSAQAAPHIGADSVVVVASKGIDETSLELMSDVLKVTLPGVPPQRVCFLSGPSFASELALGLLTDVTVACPLRATVQRVQHAFHTPTFRIYASSDIVGVQIGGAVKNVVAIAAGAGDALGYGNNSRAALITRGLMEITRLGTTLGADPLTFLGLSGVGDLVLTCCGDASRNRTLGKVVAQGADFEAYLKDQKSVAEGYHTAAAVHALAKKVGVDMPICEAVFRVLHEKMPLRDALGALVNRPYEDELKGVATPTQAA